MSLSIENAITGNTCY